MTHQKFENMKLALSLFFLLVFSFGFSQSAQILGTVLHGKEPILGATVYVHELGRGTKTNVSGQFTLKELKAGSYTLRINFTGFKTLTQIVLLNSGDMLQLEFQMEEDVFSQSEVVVSATRNQIRRQDAPVIVNAISNRTFEATQSLSLAEGLSFSPGLRLENNCQNCGFTQLRMNGLDGAYSQILINSRPVFSALAGVYGLEMLPANMVDRIEVVRGGGSVLFGGNAIAGTVNIITKDPLENAFEVGINQAFTNLETSDRTMTFNASLVSEDFKKGITFFGFNRDRNPWDANGDGFSETTKLKNNTFGFDAFWNFAERSKFKLGLYYIYEFRRGGSDFYLAPHQSRLAEQLQHNITALNTSVEHYSKNFKHKFAFYTSAQWVSRDSYYGAGGRIIPEGDSLTQTDLLALNAYGQSEDASVVLGTQYNFEISKKWQLTSGTEFNCNKVQDRMLGYGRRIDQNVGTIGMYMQMEFKPIEKLTLLAGARFDYLNIEGNYLLQNTLLSNSRNLRVPVPRLTAMYQIQKFWKLRASFAQGYRGPQAFDEDLHLETVGGAARFIVLSEDMKVERSNAANFSLNFDKKINQMQLNLVAEAFYTQLKNPFIVSNPQELPSGISVIAKRNGTGAQVYGGNLELNIALRNQWMLQSGATLQRATYDKEELIWESDEVNQISVFTRNILRTPNVYGYLTLMFNPNKHWSFNYSSVFTGAMIVPHVIDPQTEQTVLKTTPVFWENNVKLSYSIFSKDNYRIQVFAGVQNMFNSFQRDFDSGQFRDAGYVYGPSRPRTIFFGLKFGLR